MSLNLNKAILAGRITHDIELKQTPNGTAVSAFSIAVNRPKPKEGGEQQADFINCVAWRSTAEFIAKYFQKGSSILICGAIQTRTWQDNSGQKKYAMEVLVQEASFVESKAASNAAQAVPQAPQGAYSAAAKNDAIFDEMSKDEDLPF